SGGCCPASARRPSRSGSDQARVTGLQITSLDPLAADRWRPVVQQQINELCRSIGFLQKLPVFGLEKALRDGMIEPGKERLEESLHVKNANRLGVQPELGPGQDFE